MKKNIFSISLMVILSLVITIVIFSCSTSDISSSDSGDNNGENGRGNGGGTTVDEPVIIVPDVTGLSAISGTLKWNILLQTTAS
jgi:hypothetical protein